MTQLIIDNREAKLLSLFEKKSTIPFEKKQLDIGDIKIVKDITTIVIERKTIKDLLASIKDGRYKEQKTRLQSQIQQNNIKTYFYILEGQTYNLKQYEKNIYNGALISIQLRDGIQMIKTDNLDDTFQFITRLMSRMEKKDIFYNSSNNIENQTYLSSIKLRKKDNIQPKEAQILMFSNIPGVSVKIGEVIINKYSNIMELFDIYQGIETENEKEKLLENIIVSEKRKIGAKTSKKIYDYLFKI